MDVAFDIETAPLEYGKHIKTDEEGNIQDIGALSPITGRIIAVGYKTMTATNILVNEDEKQLLQTFWQELKTHTNNQFVKFIGFNSSFDMHFLLVRSLKHNIPIIKNRMMLDLRTQLTVYNRYAKGTLDDYAEILGMPGKHDNIKSSEIPNLWKQKKYDLIKKYLEQDVLITQKLFLKCKALGILKE